MDCFRRALKVEQGSLYAKRLFRRWVRIDPGDITRVREFGGNNPHLKIWSAQGAFIVGACASGFDDVVRFIEERTAYSVEGSISHRYNRAIYRTPASTLFGWMFRRQRSGGSDKRV